MIDHRPVVFALATLVAMPWWGQAHATPRGTVDRAVQKTRGPNRPDRFRPATLYPTATRLGEFQSRVAIPLARTLSRVAKGSLRRWQPNTARPETKIVEELVDVKQVAAELRPHLDKPFPQTYDGHVARSEYLDAVSKRLLEPYRLNGRKVNDRSSMDELLSLAGRHPADGTHYVKRTSTVRVTPPARVEDPRVPIARRILNTARKDPEYARLLNEVTTDTAKLARLFATGNEDKVRLANWPHTPRLSESAGRLFRHLEALGTTDSTRAWTEERQKLGVAFPAADRRLIQDASAETLLLPGAKPAH